jgi:beta-glucosidase/6-phospho-beta-glucosidase/beta-galactosidase
MQFSRSDFPEDFLFGVATSAYQIEGHQFGGADLTHWDSFAATPGNVVRAEMGVACDHYHRWEEDLDLIAALGADVYRFSTSWARVMPEGGTPNAEGLDFYDRLVDGMLARGLKPAATLYHWELPQALADQGRLAQCGHAQLVRRLHPHHHVAHRRPGLVRRAHQRALVRRLAQPFRGRACTPACAISAPQRARCTTS